ncbi:MAG: hypothetical protein AAB899_02565 [Patescibacteria group bacterium]
MTNPTNTEIPRSIARKFAHLIVAGDDEKSLHKSIDYLTQQVLLEKGAGSPRVVRNNFEEYFHIKFGEDEISESLGRLVRQGFAKEGNGAFSLDVKQEGYLKKLNADTRSKERQIYNTWIASISPKYPELTQQDREWLIDDLKVYLYRLFLRNGAECAALLNPARTSNTIAQSSEELLRHLPQRSKEIATIRKIEFPRFLSDAHTERRVYFASLLDGTFIYQIIQTDPDTFKAIKDNFKNYTFYLDTNILFSILGLRDAHQTSTVEKAFEIAKSFGIKFVVSTKTMEEMRFAIQSQADALLRSPTVRRDLAEIGADISEEESLTTAYWRAYAKTGISREDFLERFRHLSDLLNAKNIQVVDDHFIPARKTLKAEKEALKKSIQIKKSENVAEHDAYHRLLISFLRDWAFKKNSPQRYWFLSWDNQLSKYANKVRKSDEVSFLYLPHQLVQMLRLYTQRTTDYDETFLELFTRPQIKSAQNVIPNDFAEKVLTKISSFSDLPEELAVKIMLDSSFISRIANTSDQNISKEIDKEVDTRVAEQLKDLNSRVKRLERQNLESAKEKEQIQTDASASIGRKDKQADRIRTALLIMSLLFLIAVAYIFYDKLWDQLTLIPRLIALVIGLGAMLGVLRLKWNIGVTFAHIGTAIGISGAFFVVAFLNLPIEEEKPSVDSLPFAITASSASDDATTTSPTTSDSSNTK